MELPRRVCQLLCRTHERAVVVITRGIQRARSVVGCGGECWIVIAKSAFFFFFPSSFFTPPSLSGRRKSGGAAAKCKFPISASYEVQKWKIDGVGEYLLLDTREDLLGLLDRSIGTREFLLEFLLELGIPSPECHCSQELWTWIFESSMRDNRTFSRVC